MRHGSLFSGIGGFDLASEWMGWENVFHCEWNPFGQKILKHYWPEAELFTDITKSDFTKYANRIDVLTGGFPCQPYSTAGKRLGKEDDRHLWPEMFRAIREVQPPFVVGENVSGLINWNGGLVFDEVQADLEAAGYEVIPFVLPACGVGAPHRRDRVWFVAHAIGPGTGSNGGPIGNEGRRTSENRGEGLRQTHGQTGAGGTDSAGSDGIIENSDPTTNGRPKTRRNKPINRDFSTTSTIHASPSSDSGLQRPEIGQQQPMGTEQFRQERDVTDAKSKGLERGKRSRKSIRLESGGEENAPISPKSHKQWDRVCKEFRESPIRGRDSNGDWFANFPTQPPVRQRNDGLSSRLAGITVSKHRNESLKGYGNAVVPQIPFQIFKAIEQFEKIERE